MTEQECEALPDELAVKLRDLLVSIVREDARGGTSALPGGRIPWPDLDRTLEDYPATFIAPPPNFADRIEREACYGELKNGSGFWIDCPLWTEEEGRSDMMVSLFAYPIENGGWNLEVDNVRVQ